MKKLLTFAFLAISLLGYTQKKKDNPVLVFEERTENGLKIFASNQAIVPHTVDISINQKNLKSDTRFPVKTVLDAGVNKVLIATLTIVNSRKGWSFGYEYTFFQGDYRATHDDDFIYALPYLAGSEYLMSQGYNGRFSHSGKNALDFTMPTGTKIVAARGGLVTQVKESSNKGCKNRSCLGLANKITILHDDGTLADYAHLKKKGALVEVGDRVQKGDVIGLSGNTGFTSGPHLHFEVYLPGVGNLKSVPTKFEVAPGQYEYLKEKVRYEAF